MQTVKEKKPIRKFNIDPTLRIRTSIADTVFADAVSQTPDPKTFGVGPPEKTFMCLISWERTQKRTHINLFRGHVGVKKGVPNGPFWATKGFSLLFFSLPLSQNFGIRGKMGIFLTQSALFWGGRKWGFLDSETLFSRLGILAQGANGFLTFADRSSSTTVPALCQPILSRLSEERPLRSRPAPNRTPQTCFGPCFEPRRGEEEGWPANGGKKEKKDA